MALSAFLPSLSDDSLGHDANPAEAYLVRQPGPEGTRKPAVPSLTAPWQRQRGELRVAAGELRSSFGPTRRPVPRRLPDGQIRTARHRGGG